MTSLEQELAAFSWVLLREINKCPLRSFHYFPECSIHLKHYILWMMMLQLRGHSWVTGLGKLNMSLHASIGIYFFTNFAQVDLWNLRCSGLWDAMHSPHQNSDKTVKNADFKKSPQWLQTPLSSRRLTHLPPSPPPPPLASLMLPPFSCLCPCFVVSICLSSCLSLSNTDPGAPLRSQSRDQMLNPSTF